MATHMQVLRADPARGIEVKAFHLRVHGPLDVAPLRTGICADALQLGALTSSQRLPALR
jgi:hypothetical protein